MSIQSNADIVVGSVLATGGGTGAIISLATSTLSLVTLCINLSVGVGGIYLLYLRIKSIKEENKLKAK